MTLTSGHGRSATSSVRVVGADERVGVVSDIDDTVMITALPRPLRAFWNTFVQHESSRRPVPGMSRLFEHLRAGDEAVHGVRLHRSVERRAVARSGSWPGTATRRGRC